MLGRVDEKGKPGGRDVPRRHRRGVLRTRRERLLFVLATSVFALTMVYASTALLARVTPALVKGQEIVDIPVIGNAIKKLPDIVEPDSPAETSVFNRRINILVIGVDKRPGWIDEGPYHTDTLMVASLDPVSKTISVLSFPRDLWVDINPKGGGSFKSRINNSFGFGFQEEKTIEGGAEQLARDMEKDFGIKIDHWVWMDFKGVENLINAVGGVEVDIPEQLAVYEWYYTDDDETDPHYESFFPGPVELNGYRAVAFGRFRNDSDLYRVKRQQLVLSAAIHAVFSRGILSRNIGEIYDAYAGFVHHNVPPARALSYLPLLKETGGITQALSVGDPVNGISTVEGFTTEDGAAVLAYNVDNVRYWLDQAFTKTAYVRSSVQIRNGFGEGGDAREAALGRYLKYAKGLPVVDLGGEVAVREHTTLVLYGEGRRQLAEDIAAWMGLPASAIELQAKTATTDPDVLIVIGRDFALPGS